MGLTFAEQQMQKMGWKPGMGLGKNNDGISVPIKAKRFTKNLGLGHDVTKQYTHWWDFAYNKAITHVEVSKNDEGEVQVNTAVNDSLDQFKPNYARSGKLEDNFTKGKVLKPLKKSDSSKEDASSCSSSESEEESSKSLVSGNGLILDFGEELFNYCGRTTGHRAGRFVNFNGKLNRNKMEGSTVTAEVKPSLDVMSESCRKLCEGVTTNTPIPVNRFKRIPMKGGTQIGFTYETHQEKKRKKRKIHLTDEQIAEEIKILFLPNNFSSEVSETSRRSKKARNRSDRSEKS